MSVIARRVISTPERTTSSTWKLITQIVCQDDTAATAEFDAVAGLASACISEETMRADALVIVGKGARLRVYCLHGDDAISGDQRNEDPLAWRPTDGEWKAYLPCTDEDLAWVTKSLVSKSLQFVAYSITQGLPDNLREAADSGQQPSGVKSLAINVGRFNEL